MNAERIIQFALQGAVCLAISWVCLSIEFVSLKAAGFWTVGTLTFWAVWHLYRDHQEQKIHEAQEEAEGREKRTRKPKTPLQRHCTSKRKYRTFQEAQQVVKEVESRVVYIRGQRIGGPLMAYPCYVCGNYHTGHIRL